MRVASGRPSRCRSRTRSSTDLVDPALLAAIVDRHARAVCERLAKAKLSGRTVTAQGAAARLQHAQPLGHAGRPHRPTRTGEPAGPHPACRAGHLRWRPAARRRGVRVGRLGAGGPVRRRGGRRTPAAGRRRDLRVSDPGTGRVWRPGMDVEHADHGPGWVWGSGLGRVTVRFETAETPPGPVHTFATDDPDLRPRPAHRRGRILG